MNNAFLKLIDEVPIPLFRRYNIYSGSNDWTEWNSILSDYLKGNFNYYDPQLIANYEQQFAEKVC